METDVSKARASLDGARKAFKAQQYPLALELYEWFFDHALEEGGGKWVGIRLSFCLGEWAQLAKVYEPAGISLEQKRAQSISNFAKSREAGQFHDYVAICRYTGTMPQAIDTFIEFHDSDRELARRILYFIKAELRSAGKWEICNAYIQDADAAYERALETLLRPLEFAESNPEKINDEFVSTIKEQFVKNADYIVAVLSHVHRMEDARRICERANQDMKKHGVPGFLSVASGDAGV
ncbi:hypothetical protein [Undibacterium terreum]|uniref:Uncharacterized protein n=1 Tax=Undibacterium terreum TaxID=1224302 RepID=A0A916U6U0_9BURK|nr:hypothetical protein [Undibacterium terreum]GGC62865.1 hypothetical protein GCM10011396_07320 [Undibacterium terreum]